MKFLVDQVLSPIVSEALNQAGHDATHARDYGMQWAEDEEILTRAAREGRVLVSSSSDFARQMMVAQERGPSLVLFARSTCPDPRAQAKLLLGHLPQIQKALDRGSFVVIDEFRIRVWSLPLALKCQPA